MKSMLSSRTKNNKNRRITVSMTKEEVLEVMKELKHGKLKLHLTECLLKIEHYDKYQSEWVDDER